MPSHTTDLGLDDGAGLIHAVLVGGAAHVLARVLRVHPAEVHRHVAKVVDRLETVLCGTRSGEGAMYQKRRLFGLRADFRSQNVSRE